MKTRNSALGQKTEEAAGGREEKGWNAPRLSVCEVPEVTLKPASLETKYEWVMNKENEDKTEKEN
jgi:hypothetical protein